MQIISMSKLVILLICFLTLNAGADENYKFLNKNYLKNKKVVILGSYKQCHAELLQRVDFFEKNNAIVGAPIKSKKAGVENADFVVLKADIDEMIKSLKFQGSEMEFMRKLTDWQTGKKSFSAKEEDILIKASKILQDAVNKKIKNADIIYIVNARYCNKKDLGENWTGHSTDMEFGFAISYNKTIIFENEPATLNHKFYGLWKKEDILSLR